MHCGIEESSTPGISGIVCHQVLRHPSEHRAGSMGKFSLAKAHMAMLHQVTESEVNELTSLKTDETAFTILNRQGSRGITIASLQRKLIFDIQVNPYILKWQIKPSQLAAKDFETSEFHQDTWNCYLMLGFIWAHIPWKAITNLKLRQSYQALRSDLVLPSTTTLSNICRRAYALTVDAIKKQLPLRNTVCLAWDGWTSTTKLAITSVIAY